jgi:hypothetical protein
MTEPIARVEKCAGVWVVTIGDARIGPVYVESEANEIAESINTANESAKSSAMKSLESERDGLKQKLDKAKDFAWDREITWNPEFDRNLFEEDFSHDVMEETNDSSR